MRWGIAAPALQSRKQAAADATMLAKIEADAELRKSIREAVDGAWLEGNPLNREGVKDMMKRKNTVVTETIENLLTEKWLHEVSIHSKDRLHTSKKSFLVNLTTTERDAVLRGEGVADEKQIVPPSWRKVTISSIPAASSTNCIVKEGEHAQ